MSDIVFVLRKNNRKFLFFALFLIAVVAFSIVKVFVLKSEEDEYASLAFIRLVVGEISLWHFSCAKFFSLIILLSVLFFMTYNDFTVKLMVVPVVVFFNANVTECMCGLKYYPFLAFIPSLLYFLIEVFSFVILAFISITLDNDNCRLERGWTCGKTVSPTVIFLAVVIVLLQIVRALIFLLFLM